MANIDNLNGKIIKLAPFPGNGVAIGKPTRKLIQWNIPHKGVVEMYINPQLFSIQETKLIKETRTKGGYIVQYWGEQLAEIDISGNTGSGGIEGINVLESIYRQEQFALQGMINRTNTNFLNDIFSSATQALGKIVNPFSQSSTSAGSTAALLVGLDPVTIAATATTVEALKDPDSFWHSVVSAADGVSHIIDRASNFISGAENSQFIPTLASLATAVELMYDGMIYRGFFRNFKVEERADLTGIFTYTMKFVVTRRTGQRFNGFPWQRSIEFGGADADHIPLSFGALEVSNTAAVLPPPAIPSRVGTTVPRRQQITGK